MYADIDRNKRQSVFLISVFIGLFVLVGYLFGVWYGDEWIGLILATVIASGSALIGFYHGDKIALLSAGARPLQKSDAPALYNTVDNLSIALGIKTPKVYLIQDPAPNAFATGRDPAHASIAVSTGLLQTLDRTELEGVIAHELSHIQNYDIRLMMLVAVLVGGIILLSDWMTRGLFFGRGDRDRDRNVPPALLIVGLILVILSPLIAQLIKLAISRSREYLADASGALLTRYPEGLARALEKIATLDKPMQRPNHATAHLFLASPFDPHVPSRFATLFSTHPPIEERIARLRKMGV